MNFSFAIILKVIWYFIKCLFRHNENLWPIIKSLRYYYAKVRISTAAILLIEDQDGFVLIKSRQRPELYGPIGGVHKFMKPAQAGILNEIEWASDSPTASAEKNNMEHDLRGIIRGKFLPTFLEWFCSRKNREGDSCVLRELVEEIAEIGADEEIKFFSHEIRMDYFSCVLEGPFRVIDRSYDAQFRYFEIYRPDMNNEETRQLMVKIISQTKKDGENLILATRDEIKKGRTKNGKKTIASHSAYFFSGKWTGNEPRAY